MTITNAGGTNYATFISTADLKAWLRVDHSDEDAIIEALRATAFEWVQDYCRVFFGSQTITAYLDGYYSGRLACRTITSVDSVQIIRTGAADYSNLDSAYYDTDVSSKQPRVWFQGGPSLVADRYHPVKITMTGGYTTSNVPPQLLIAVKNYVAHLYENRSAVSPVALKEVPMALYNLVSNFRAL